MDFEGKQDHAESSASPGHVSVQESKVNTIKPTSGSDNPELGTEALTRIVKKVLEEMFEVRIRGISETLQARCVDYGKKKGRNPLRLEHHSAKHVYDLKMRLCVSTLARL
ncbi:hypothetical protein J1N35_039023 [Gossypium stocksii]|uniref:Uncharacterized protein n=1 Tax=Gossypium stocksii TaxID=47602 RepID=A0A9D3UPZ1_9ROSI|nr:hypothetical protein J1N35_039023 [Gossypium stocksii]